jgi:hypothetical protein
MMKGRTGLLMQASFSPPAGRAGLFLIWIRKVKSRLAEQAAEKVDSERVLVAQALLPVLNLQHLHSAHSQECLCYWTFSAACEACPT